MKRDAVDVYEVDYGGERIYWAPGDRSPLRRPEKPEGRSLKVWEIMLLVAGIFAGGLHLTEWLSRPAKGDQFTSYWQQVSRGERP